MRAAFILPTRFDGALPIEVCAWAMDSAGADPDQQLNAGALALAGWLVANPEEARERAKRPTSALCMADVITRILAGMVIPSDQLGEALGQMTKGAVTLAAFSKPAPALAADLVRARGDVAFDAIAATIERAERDEPAPPVLGETPAGRLITCRRKGSAFEVRGFGGSVRLGRSAAAALHAELGRELRAN